MITVIATDACDDGRSTNMTVPRSGIARDPQLDSRERFEARWLDVFAVFQVVCGLLYCWVAVSGVPENVPLFVPALAHFTLGWCLWARRRRFWVPHVVVLINPWVTFAQHRLYPPPPSPPHGFGSPLLLLIPLPLLAAYVWELVVFVILLARAGALLRPRRPFKLRLAGFMVGCVVVASAVGLDLRMPLQRERHSQWVASQANRVPHEPAAFGHWNQWNYGAQVAEALGAIGPEAVEAVPTLLAATKSDIPEVRVAAVAALRRIAPGTILDQHEVLAPIEK